MKKIEITIDEENGDVNIEAIGYEGNSCLDATKFIEDLLGSPSSRQKKKEFFRKNTTNNKRHLKQGE